MKKRYVLSFVLIMLFLFSTVCCSDGNGFPVKDAEKGILKWFPYKDQGGYYNFYCNKNISLNYEEAIKFIKDHNMEITWQNFNLCG